MRQKAGENKECPHSDQEKKWKIGTKETQYRRDQNLTVDCVDDPVGTCITGMYNHIS